MARSKRASTEDAAPTAEAIAEATSDVPPPSNEMTDQQILEYIQSQQADRPAAPAAPRKTISDVYTEMVSLVASAAGRRRPVVSENTAVKVLEMTLGWHLQTRNQPTDIFPPEVLGGGSDGSEENDGPVPHETIDAADDAAPESE